MATSPTLEHAPRPTRRRDSSESASLTLFPSAVRHGARELAESAPDEFRPTHPEPEAPAKLAGIARLAASSPRAEAKRGTEYFLLPAKSILNRCDSPRMPFRWTVNPYRGCEFGCQYCYARYTHEFMELDGEDFERKIFVKRDAGELFERDLARKRVWGEHIAIGTATDPYQPAENDFAATRAILERIAERDGLSLSITTKSNRIVRDLDLLRSIAERSELFINITITTLRPRLARLLEPRAPLPSLRLDAVRRLRDARLAVGVNAMPILPGLTDRPDDLDALARAAKEAGAQWIAGGVLFLMQSAQKPFLRFIERKFPRLAGQYRSWYGRQAYPPEHYQREISKRMVELRKKYGLAVRPAPNTAKASRTPQLSLGLSSCTGCT
jgi:DNA repair photolyase